MRDTARSTVDHIYVDLGTGNTRAGYSSEGGICTGIGNYPRAPEATPSLVPQARSYIIYEPQKEGAGKPVGFGYAIPRRNPRQEAIKEVLLWAPARVFASYPGMSLDDERDNTAEVS